MTSEIDDGNQVSFIDFLFIILLGLAAILLLMVEQKKVTVENVEKNALYQVIMTWEGDSNNDVDLWVKDPKGRIVGFNRREGGRGSLHSLAHDDLGMINDLNDGEVIPENREVVSIRGIIPGEYVANCHMYAKRDIEGTFRVTAKLIKVKPYVQVISVEVLLVTYGDEKTFFRFTFDEDEKIIDTNTLPARGVAKPGNR